MAYRPFLVGKSRKHKGRTQWRTKLEEIPPVEKKSGPTKAQIEEWVRKFSR